MPLGSTEELGIPRTLGFVGAVGRTDGAGPGKMVPEPPMEGNVDVDAYGSNTGAAVVENPPAGASGVIAGAAAPGVLGRTLPVEGGNTVPCAYKECAR